ncbi:4'-phosphopantetheinyl transferase family protein [Methylopila turkensis]|uniref:4'-phosphopantetheinyl transferase n=1 Tax=Methylopila turkensis TaxID=1437816 RepID=A0A9W6JPT2_9HYPH|nr:4'-phosphopantetheinyl transferase superfamily protein [Methylopila turkensis]GLK81525.1 hypothetical protein GCM10008174_32660 [Methylopila turkensis]
MRAVLSPQRADLWLADPDAVSPEREERLLRLLTPEETGRWERFAVPSPKRQHLVARALLRLTLSRYADVAPERWRFVANEHGRPRLDGPEAALGLQFNLSHTDGLVALVVAAQSEIGVDVEDLGRRADMDRLAPAVFAPEEAAAFAAGPAELRRETFFALWTLKEAYVKARGRGIAMGLKTFAFQLDGPSPAVTFGPSCADDPARWRFWRLRPTPRHALALAASAEVAEVRAHWTTFDDAP